MKQNEIEDETSCQDAALTEKSESDITHDESESLAGKIHKRRREDPHRFVPEAAEHIHGGKVVELKSGMYWKPNGGSI